MEFLSRPLFFYNFILRCQKQFTPILQRRYRNVTFFSTGVIDLPSVPSKETLIAPKSRSSLFASVTLRKVVKRSNAPY
jgi:hypothetical protein